MCACLKLILFAHSYKYTCSMNHNFPCKLANDTILCMLSLLLPDLYIYLYSLLMCTVIICVFKVTKLNVQIRPTSIELVTNKYIYNWLLLLRAFIVLSIPIVYPWPHVEQSYNMAYNWVLLLYVQWQERLIHVKSL